MTTGTTDTYALDQERDRLVVGVETGWQALTGEQFSEARWIVGAIPTIDAFKECGLRYEVPGRKTRMSIPRVKHTAPSANAAESTPATPSMV